MLPITVASHLRDTMNVTTYMYWYKYKYKDQYKPIYKNFLLSDERH